MWIIASASWIFSLESVFSRSAFWSLVFPSLILSSATFKLDFWLLNSSSSSSIFGFWLCNNPAPSSSSLVPVFSYIEFSLYLCVSNILALRIFTEEISYREIWKFVTPPPRQTSSFIKRNNSKVFSKVERPCTSKWYLFIENPRSGVLFPWLRDKIYLHKLTSWAYFCQPSSLNILPIFLQ